MIVNQSGAAPCGPFRPREPSFLCIAVIMASMKLTGEIFAVRHRPYLMSEFELCRPSDCRENGWEHFCDEQDDEYEKRQQKF